MPPGSPNSEAGSASTLASVEAPRPPSALELAVTKLKDRYRLYKHAGYGPPYSDDYDGNLPEECNTFLPNVQEIHGMLKRGADPNARVKADNGCTAVHYAARYGLVEVLTMLQLAGGDVNTANTLGMTPLSYACRFPLVAEEDGKGLLAKRQTQTVLWLLDAGAEVDLVDKGGFTPLLWACRSGLVAGVQALLAAGAKLTRTRKWVDVMGITSDPKIRSILQAEVDRIRAEEEAVARAKALAETAMPVIDPAVAAQREKRRQRHRAASELTAPVRATTTASADRRGSDSDAGAVADAMRRAALLRSTLTSGASARVTLQQRWRAMTGGALLDVQVAPHAAAAATAGAAEFR
ncbi:ankyrin repeat-containing domain protein [Tribonema minus]|uniref:Ankyrin repeat-containing domain protein n=1 Tax=Tribonema minus TaxID=303371 RepID=A0A835Z886_9STRA|nr:ankyrin repeat-containing domain protein [Tribonema minus]